MGQQAHITLIVVLGVSWFLCWRLAFRLLPPEMAAQPPPADTVSIIIPARNEAANLPGLLDSLAAQEIQPLEVIVVDDDSSDDTSAIAAGKGATVIHPGPPPPGWRGKTWPCRKGAEAARGKLLLFLDADTRLIPGHGLSRMLDRYPGGAWSLIPWHDAGGGGEALSAFFNLMMALGTIPRGLAGPCLIIPRAEYEAFGGHRAVKDRILENVHLAGVLLARGVPTASAAGKGILGFRMYPGGIRELIPGWSKGFAGGAATTPPGTLLLIIMWMSSLWGAAGTLFLSPVFAFIYLLYVVQLGWMLRRVGHFPIWVPLFYPVSLAFYLVVFIRSLGPAGRQVTWKGRKVVADVD
ncbi:glycosyltransferase [Luteolibacter sp. SL250]|uniref:glycosyltransferase n=1 Tax=Luteolibacter sp. SL250 TaxID=2995170 RepID=UPI00227023D8|nr:glycosyltransferase [Luteolibacter sp. SL250]WAC21114.1 glycosyltransferase [Luteolibacter sp. SL250]